MRCTTNYPKSRLRQIAMAAVLTICGFVLPERVRGQEVADQVEAVKKKNELEEPNPTIDLGSFAIRDYRPMRNETAKLNFSIHLSLSELAPDMVAEQLEHWRHRLRDQVIIAVRKSLAIDFQQPGLDVLRRRILLRLNRVLKKPLIAEALLPEFTYTTH